MIVLLLFQPMCSSGRNLRPIVTSLCLFDWELSSIHVPQHDLGYFLCTAVLISTDPLEEVQSRIMDYCAHYHEKLCENLRSKNKPIPAIYLDRTKCFELLHYCIMGVFLERTMVLAYLPEKIIPHAIYLGTEGILRYMESVIDQLSFRKDMTT